MSLTPAEYGVVDRAVRYSNDPSPENQVPLDHAVERLKLARIPISIVITLNNDEIIAPKHTQMEELEAKIKRIYPNASVQVELELVGTNWDDDHYYLPPAWWIRIETFEPGNYNGTRILLKKILEKEIMKKTRG